MVDEYNYSCEPGCELCANFTPETKRLQRTLFAFLREENEKLMAEWPDECMVENEDYFYA